MLRKLTVAAFAVLFMTGALHAQNVAYKTVTGEQVKLNVDKMMSVSYTHLTLPTICSV